MSISAQEKVYTLPIADAVAVNILAYLAFRSNAKNGDCHPSRERIARDLRYDRATVLRKLRWLEANGYIAITRPAAGRGAANQYTLILEKGVRRAPLNDGEKRAHRIARRGAEDPEKGRTVHPQPKEPKEHGARPAVDQTARPSRAPFSVEKKSKQKADQSVESTRALAMEASPVARPPGNTTRQSERPELKGGRNAKTEKALAGRGA